MSFPETKLWKIFVEVRLRLRVAQMTPCVQPALVLPIVAPPAPNSLGDRAGLLWPILSVSILRVPGYVRLFRVVGWSAGRQGPECPWKAVFRQFYGSRFGPMLGMT